VAPPEPLEEVYYTLSQLKSLVDPGKLSLMLTTTGTAWYQNRLEGPVTAAQIQTLRKSIFSETYYSGRYACSYLTDASTARVVWYLDEQSVTERVRMAAFFGVGQVCLSDLRSVADYEGYSLLAALSEEKRSPSRQTERIFFGKISPERRVIQRLLMPSVARRVGADGDGELRCFASPNTSSHGGSPHLLATSWPTVLHRCR
jgi:hypothetical protein